MCNIQHDPDIMKRIKEGYKRSILQMMSNIHNVSLDDLLSKSRQKEHVVFARHMAMYVMHTVFSMSYEEIGDCFKRHRTSVTHACKKIEDRRENSSIDHCLHYLEGGLRLTFLGAEHEN